MSDEERRIIDTRLRPQEPELEYEPDLVISISTNGDRYDVIYNRKNEGDTEYAMVVFIKLNREEMVTEHIRHIMESKPKTVMITAEGVNTPLHPGVVKSIIEGKLGIAELLLR